MLKETRILVVEDDTSMGYLISTLLEGEGFAVDLVQDGEAALAAYKPGVFDLCLL
ncbi:MAG: response regulator, partial [Saprospiraceae bacterium]